MHKGVIAIALVGALVAGYAVGYTTAPKEAGMEQVTLILNWTIASEQALFFAAIDQGFYAEEGLSVTALRGYGSGDTALRVEAGEGEFGYVDMGTHILAEGEGEVDLLQVCIGYHKSPFAIGFAPDAPITEPKDLEGKTIATNPADAAYFMFIGPLAAATGLDVDAINFDFSAPYATESRVVAGAVDAALIYRNTGGAILESELGGVGMLLYSDYGVDVYANGVVVKESYAQENPDIVRRFVRATLRGRVWTLQNQTEAIDMMVRLFPELDREKSAAEFRYTLDIFWNEETQQYGLGYMIPEKVENTIDIVCESFGVTTDIQPEDIYTNEFVEGLPDEILFPTL